LDSKIALYIEKQQSPQKEIILKVRAIFNENLQNFEEEKKWGAIIFASGKFYLGVVKDRVHVGFAVSGLTKEEIKLLEGTGKTMRHIKIHSLDSIDEEKLVKLIQLVDRSAICEQC